MIRTPSSNILLALAVAASLGLAGCATTNAYTGQTNDPNDPNRTRTGALVGAGIGAVAGLITGDDATERRQRALAGAAAGALVGGAVGVYQDRQEAALRQQMAGTGVDVVREGDNIVLTMPDAITFGFDSAVLSAQFRPVLDNLAATLNEYPQTRVQVVGHTDSVGSTSYNQTLSQQRAMAVATYLSARGVAWSRMTTLGAGESQPVASNATESGRAMNRRVEITLVPITQ